MPAPLKFTAAQQSKLQAIGIQPAKVTRAYIKREGFDTKAEFLEHANFEYRISAKYGAVAAQRKIARLLERPLGIPRPQWRALRLYEESVRVEGDLAGAAAAMEEGADTALPPPPRAKIKASQVAPL